MVQIKKPPTVATFGLEEKIGKKIRSSDAMTKDRLRELLARYATGGDFSRAEIAEILIAVESLMAESTALRNFASPVWATDAEEAHWRKADKATESLP